MSELPVIAVFSGPTATIQNSAPLVSDDSGGALRAQYLAADAWVYVDAYSAHPLEIDSSELYGPPHGYLAADGTFARGRTSHADRPVYRVRLTGEDGPFLLPYVARQKEGSSWTHQGVGSTAAWSQTRQTFYPDASRIFDEIDRFGVDESGRNRMLSRRARFRHFRAAPSGGYPKGRSARMRTDAGTGDIAPETPGVDFHPYIPAHLAHHPPRPTLARLTNSIASTLGGQEFDGALWLEGSASMEETLYWLSLLVDTRLPLAGVTSKAPHGTLRGDGDANIVDAVEYLAARVTGLGGAADDLGAVLIQDRQILAAREVHKVAARAGGYTVAGGLGGRLGLIRPGGSPLIPYRPGYRHTHRSLVSLRHLPHEVPGAGRRGNQAVPVQVPTRTEDGLLIERSIPRVSICKHVRYGVDEFLPDGRQEIEVLERVSANLERFPLAGFVLEGMSAYGTTDESLTAALRVATYSGMPVVCVGRGGTEDVAEIPSGVPFLSGSNLTATKARMLLMACLLRFGALPPAADAHRPTDAERDSTMAVLERYQSVCDSH